MENIIKAFWDFLTDLFAALSEFLGKEFEFGDLIGGIEDALGDIATTNAAE